VSSLTTVDGLVSGLSTSSIISQLMQIEAQPQTNLKNKITDEQSVISAYQSVNTKMAALKTASEALNTSTAWKSMTAKSSAESVTTSITGTPVAGTTSFKVTELAAAHSVTSKLPAGAQATSGGGIDITYGSGRPLHIAIPLAKDNAQGVADAVNAKDFGVKASVVSTDAGDVVQFTSTTPGADNVFPVTGLAVPAQVAVQGTDAELTFGNPAAGGYTVHSNSNTFTDVIPGVSFTATKKPEDVSITVDSDASGIADKMQALVDAANAALSQIGSQTATNAAAKTRSPLAGDHAVRQLQQQILSGVSAGLAGSGSFKQLGVELTRDGALKFDKDAFLAAYKTDPDAAQNLAATGLADKLHAVADTATDSVSGSLTLQIQSGNNQIRDLNKKIADWDVRLASRQQALQRQYSSLEVALGKMKNQSSWLASQVAGLPTSSTG
jgi:flagellar hook-associated protein 2